MAVPASGELKLWDTLWNQELAGTKGENSLHSASVYAGFSTPDALSDFYGWSDVEAPQVTTNSISGIGHVSMTLNANLTSTGNEAVTRGFYFGTNPSSAGSNPKLSLGGTQNATGPFSCGKTGLTAQTQYFAWAFACNSAGECIGSRVQATTTAPPFSPTIVDFGANGRNTYPADNANANQGYFNPYTSGFNTLGSLSAAQYSQLNSPMNKGATNACNRSLWANNAPGSDRANALFGELVATGNARFNNRAFSVQTNEFNPGNPISGVVTSSQIFCNRIYGRNPYLSQGNANLQFTACYCLTGTG